MVAEPFKDMSKFEDDKTPVESGEKFTVDEWRVVTQDWDPVNSMLVQYAAALDPKERETAASEYTLKALFGVEKGDEHFSFVADLMSLSNPALDRLSQALLLNELEDTARNNPQENNEKTKEDWLDLIERGASGTITAAREQVSEDEEEDWTDIAENVLDNYVKSGLAAGLSAIQIWEAITAGRNKGKVELDTKPKKN